MSRKEGVEVITGGGGDGGWVGGRGEIIAIKNVKLLKKWPTKWVTGIFWKLFLLKMSFVISFPPPMDNFLDLRLRSNLLEMLMDWSTDSFSSFSSILYLILCTVSTINTDSVLNLGSARLLSISYISSQRWDTKEEVEEEEANQIHIHSLSFIQLLISIYIFPSAAPLSIWIINEERIAIGGWLAIGMVKLNYARLFASFVRSLLE